MERQLREDGRGLRSKRPQGLLTETAGGVGGTWVPVMHWPLLSVHSVLYPTPLSFPPFTHSFIHAPDVRGLS